MKTYSLSQLKKGVVVSADTKAEAKKILKKWHPNYNANIKTVNPANHHHGFAGQYLVKLKKKK